jgi:hypothetical protein
MARIRPVIQILDRIDLGRERWASLERFRDAHPRPWRGLGEFDSMKTKATHPHRRVIRRGSKWRQLESS